MIEVKNLVKVYKPKKGVPVRAVDGVSLKIEEKGMVFILGKSGSGKSTLLNLLGGLDRYDEGEIIIKGKSSKDFSQSEFDSYRNTYLGFIFQEYNILNDFSVGANIALAMELQGKKATPEALNELLKTVDLEGYAHRKPNELSGGQKQRVAIARALIKNPEIIMADEPTGALDSNTGKQVFETLQKLSKEKLVIIISHDREFAEYYGDRVIEMADGKIISDIKKYKAESETKSDGVSVIDDKIIHVKKGYKLTEKDLKLINEYVSKNADSDTLISIDGKANLDFRKQARIDENGARDAFADTKEGDVKVKEYQKDDFKLIKSRLPIKNAVKIGASSLKAKPFRLVLTILLSAVALVLFGIAATAAAYNKTDAAIQSIQDKGINYVAFQKAYQENEEYSWLQEQNMTMTDATAIATRYSDMQFYPVISSRYLNLSISDSIYDSSDLSGANFSQYYAQSFNGLTAIDQAGMDALGYTVEGRLPTADNEIAITKYTSESFVVGGYADIQDNTGDNHIPENLTTDKLIGKNLYISYGTNEWSSSTTPKKIVGIIDTKFDTSRYESLKPSETSNPNQGMGDYMLSNEFSTIVGKSFHNLVYVSTTKFADIQAEKTEGGVSASTSNVMFGPDQAMQNTFGYNAMMFKQSNLQGVITPHYFDATKTTLSENEIIVSMSVLSSYNNYQDTGFTSFSPYSWEAIGNFANNNITEQMYNDAVAGGYYREDAFVEFKQELANGITSYINNKAYGYEVNETSRYGVEFAPFYNAYMPTVYTSAKAFVEAYLSTVYARVGYNYDDPLTELKIVGVYDDIITNGSATDIITMSDSTFATMGLDKIELYSVLLAKMPTDTKAIADIVEFSDTITDRVQYKLVNAASSSLSTINDYIEMFTEVFVYIGIGFAAFAALMLMNYIATSISYKKREIGILRAVGARGADVFSIFFSEAFIISIINFALALTSTIVAVFFINKLFSDTLNMLISIMSFGIVQGLMMLGISVGSAFIASFIPVTSIASKKPIDAIQNR